MNNHACSTTRLASVEDILRKFWELEEYVDNNIKLSVEEQVCENYFVNTTSRDASGRFVVRLPFHEGRAQLGRSKEIAMRRLIFLERKFHRNPNFYKLYSEFMREYIELNHMSKVIRASISNPVYLPHHGVFRESNITSRLRVVFDASAKTTSDLSLNDTLMVGANLQDNINIILRFRVPTIAITADLKKMYRQILLHHDDRDYQRILWRFSPNDSIDEYQLNTVTYGQACAPFLAVRCVRQLAENGACRFNRASHVLLNDLYVDDILTGVDNELEAIELISPARGTIARRRVRDSQVAFELREGSA